MAPVPKGTGSLAQGKHGMAWGARKMPDHWGWSQTSEADLRAMQKSVGLTMAMGDQASAWARPCDMLE